MKGIVDRFEGNKVILEVGKEIFTFNKNLFPVNIEEGDIVKQVGNEFIIDEEETKNRKKYIDNLFQSLTDDKQ